MPLGSLGRSDGAERYGLLQCPDMAGVVQWPVWKPLLVVLLKLSVPVTAEIISGGDSTATTGPELICYYGSWARLREGRFCRLFRFHPIPLFILPRFYN